jgi:hypothetical protein
MSDAYEQFADVFMGTLAGQMAGLTRDQFIAQCKAKYPDPKAFADLIAQITAVAEKQVTQAQASLKPGQVLGVAYPLNDPGGQVH